MSSKEGVHNRWKRTSHFPDKIFWNNTSVWGKSLPYVWNAILSVRWKGSFFLRPVLICNQLKAVCFQLLLLVANTCYLEIFLILCHYYYLVPNQHPLQKPSVSLVSSSVQLKTSRNNSHRNSDSNLQASRACNLENSTSPNHISQARPNINIKKLNNLYSFWNFKKTVLIITVWLMIIIIIIFGITNNVFQCDIYVDW